MIAQVVIFVIFFLVPDVCCFQLEDLVLVPPDTFRNVSELITSKGYPVEEYTVQTPDGYILPIQRIPYGKRSPKAPDKPVVFLQHAFVCDSSEWVLNDEKQSLGFVLADNGYDVWLGNIRGNTLTKRNVRLSPNQNEFWDFSFDEMALIDLPTMIDFVLNKTGQSQLSYMAHSQGTTMGFALLSTSPYYNERIKFFAALAPVAYTVNVQGVLGNGLPIFYLLQPIYKEIGLVEFLPHNDFIEKFSVYVCGSPFRFICAYILYGVYGFDPEELSYVRLPVYFNHIPAGTSTKDYIHYAQLKFSGKFRKFNYYERNLEVYNQSTPPEYDVSKITTPVALLTALNDLLADPVDVELLKPNLKALVDHYIVPLPIFNHGDFLMAIHAHTLVNEKVLSLLEKYGRN